MQIHVSNDYPTSGQQPGENKPQRIATDVSMNANEMFIIIASLMVALTPSHIHKKTNLVKGNGNHAMVIYSCIVELRSIWQLSMTSKN